MKTLKLLFMINYLAWALLTTLLVYLVAFMLYPWRRHILKGYVRLMLRLGLWLNKVTIDLTVEYPPAPAGTLFVANKDNPFVQTLLYLVLPPNTWHFWSEDTLPRWLFPLLIPCMALPFSPGNPARLATQFNTIAQLKSHDHFATLLSSTTSRQLPFAACSTGAAYLAIEKGLSVTPVAVFLRNDLHRHSRITLQVHLLAPIATEGLQSSKHDRMQLTRQIYDAIQSKR